jgi:hypothetical protein
VLGVLADGEIFSVLSGPQCSENFWWWQVRRWDGQTGWTAEGGQAITGSSPGRSWVPTIPGSKPNFRPASGLSRRL